MRWSTTCGRRSGTQAWALGLGLLFGATAAPEAPADMSVTVPLDVTLGTPVNLAESFPIVSYRINGTNYDQNDFIKVKLTSTTNLELDAPCTCSVSPQVIEWQVVEYTGAGVQTNDVVFGGLSQTVTPATAVDPTRSLLLYSYFT